MTPSECINKLHKAGWSFAAIAAAVGVTPMTIYRIRNTEANPVYKTVTALAELAKNPRRKS